MGRPAGRYFVPNADGEYYCSKCEEHKPPDAFHRYGKRSHGGRYEGLPLAPCKACRAGYMKKYSQSAEHKKANRRSVDKRADKRQQLMWSLKSGPCTVCGCQFHPVSMQFHHREPIAGRFPRVQLQACSEKRLLEEVAKCDLVCANCHAFITWTEGHNGSQRRSGGDAVVEKPIDAQISVC